MKKLTSALVIGAAALALSACESMPSSHSAKPTATVTAGNAATVRTSNDVAVVVNAFIVRNENGQETLTPVTAAGAVRSGDIVEYQALLTNNGKDRVREMTVTLDLPQGAAFTGVADPALGTQASLDGGRFLRMPIRANNNGVIENIPFEQYKSLRWTVDEIGLGATAVVKYRAKIQ